MPAARRSVCRASTSGGGAQATPATSTGKDSDHVSYHLFPTDDWVSILGPVISIEVAGFKETSYNGCALWAQATIAADD